MSASSQHDRKSNLNECKDWQPTAGWPEIQLRADLLKKLRSFFDGRGFLEVETPLLSSDTVVDRHLDPLRVAVEGSPNTHYLQTSPEFSMKRLLAAGAEAIFQITRAFRAEERGAWHNPEFTIVEWYCRGDDYEGGQQFLAEVVTMLLGREMPATITYRDAFRTYVDIDPFAASTAILVDVADRLGIAAPESLDTSDHDGWLDLFWTHRIQPHLGVDRPVIICDYPPSQAALAQVRGGEPTVAERFELFVDGVELANGYHELKDPEVLVQRAATANAARLRDGKAALPENSRLLAAMRSGLPDCTGVALGFDRVVMLAAGVDSIDRVLPFPFERA